MAQVFIGAQQKSRRCFPKESSILSKRIVGSRQKNRRFFLKEATMLRGSSQYTLRYHLTAMPWEIVIRDKTQFISTETNFFFFEGTCFLVV